MLPGPKGVVPIFFQGLMGVVVQTRWRPPHPHSHSPNYHHLLRLRGTQPSSSNSSPNPLQETDKLEDEKSGLQREIEELQKQKERLELVLEAHRPICKIPERATESDTGGAGGPSSPPATSGPVPCISLSSGPVLEPEALHTPTLMTTPSLTPFTPSPVFTYPSTPEPCASAHRRSSSSSGDPSSDPLGSPTLLAL